MRAFLEPGFWRERVLVKRNATPDDIYYELIETTAGGYPSGEVTFATHRSTRITLTMGVAGQLHLGFTHYSSCSDDGVPPVRPEAWELSKGGSGRLSLTQDEWNQILEGVGYKLVSVQQ